MLVLTSTASFMAALDTLVVTTVLDTMRRELSTSMAATQTATMNAAAGAELGKASGAFNMFRFLGGAFGIAALVAVFGRFGGVASPTAFSAGFAAVLVAAAIVSAVSAGIALLLPARPAPQAIPATAKG